MILAARTVAAIDAAIERDNGNAYKAALRGQMAACEEAYKGEDGVRSHLGFSSIGRQCTRELWLSFRWFAKASHKGQLLRLFNRGHLEEARFLAMLQAAGVTVYAADTDGRQFRVTHANGHAGSAIDCVLVNLPDLPTEPVLGEFKTHNLKSFNKLVADGVHKAKPEHVAQMQVYMNKYRLRWGLYLAVCKDDDRLHGEMVAYDMAAAEQLLRRAEYIVNSSAPPPRINESPTWFACKFCDMRKACHAKEPAPVNCRTCIHSQPIEDKRWLCRMHGHELPVAAQVQGCDDHDAIPVR